VPRRVVSIARRICRWPKLLFRLVCDAAQGSGERGDPFGSAEVGTEWRCDATVLVERVHALTLVLEGLGERTRGSSAWVVYWLGACLVDLRQQRRRLRLINACLLFVTSLG
jgi:hypothetical protein